MGAKIYNSELQRELIDGAKIQIAVDKIPNEIAEKVVPVMEVNPRLLHNSEIVRSVTVTNATSGTVYSVPAGRDFYITSISLALIKDATATSVLTKVDVTTNGVSGSLLRTSSLSLNPQTIAYAVSFPFPVKADAGTSIALTNSTNVANITSSVSITGYHIDNGRA